MEKESEADLAKKINDLNSLVSRLVDRYGDVARRLDELDSVVVGEADRYTDIAKKLDAPDPSARPAGEVATRVAEEKPAPKRAPTHSSRRPKAHAFKDADPDPLLESQEGEAGDIDAEGLEYLGTLTSFAEKTVIEAVKHAKLIKTKMEDKARSRAAEIMARAQDRAQEEADRIIAGAMLTAEERAKEIITSAQVRAQGVGAAEGRGEPARPSALRRSSSGAGAPDISATAHDLDSVLAQARQTAEPVATSAPQETTGQAARSERIRIGEEVNSDLYSGNVEITLPPPVGLNQMLQLHRHLKENPKVAVLSLTGSVDQGITIKVMVDTPIPLLKTIAELPEVRRAMEESPPADKTAPGPQMPGQTLLRKIIVNTTV